LKLIDLSHTIFDGLVTYKGLPAPHICDFLSREASREHYAPGTSFHIGKIEMVANTGTYVDAPFHRYADGADLSELPLTSLANLDAVVIRAAGIADRAIDETFFRGKSLTNKAVLIHTGWSRQWNTEHYYQNHPYLTRSAAEYLRDAGAKFVAIDSYNIDDTADLARPVHSTLLRHNIPIGEHFTNFELLPDNNFRFYAVPVKVKHFGTFPVRAFAQLP
jgi:kynurenine formamidase